jgi:hypothetical protein
MIIGMVGRLMERLFRALSRERFGFVNSLSFVMRKYSQIVTQNFTTQPAIFVHLIGELSENIWDIRKEMPVGQTLANKNIAVFL